MKYLSRRLKTAFNKSGMTLHELRKVFDGRISQSYLWYVMDGQPIKNRKQREMVEAWILEQEGE